MLFSILTPSASHLITRCSSSFNLPLSSLPFSSLSGESVASEGDLISFARVVGCVGEDICVVSVTSEERECRDWMLPAIVEVEGAGHESASSGRRV